MIGHLEGWVNSVEGDTLTIKVGGGTGYDVTCPVGRGLSFRAGDPAAVIVHTYVREDLIQLFGFRDLTERAMFRTLISAAGIGPSKALAVLGAVEVPELAAAIAGQDWARLTKIKGIGKKIAERLVVELHDKMAAHLSEAVSPELLDRKRSLTGALVKMGFREKDVDEAVASLSMARPIEELIREALRALGKGFAK